MKDVKKTLLIEWIYLRFKRTLKRNGLALQPPERIKLKELIREIVNNGK